MSGGRTAGEQIGEMGAASPFVSDPATTRLFDPSALRIVFLGTAPFAVPSLLALADCPSVQIVAVFTPPDRPAGRGRQPRASAVKLAALNHGLPVYQPERVSRGDGLAKLRELRPDLVFVAAFGEILSEQVLATPVLGAINLHASLLPRYRGAAPIQRAIMAGERVTGVTVQWMAQQMDAGDVILQHEAEIGEEEDFASLHDRLAALGAIATVTAVDLVCRGEALRIPQDHSEASYAPPITAHDLAIDWTRPAEQLARQVRALSPLPGARTIRQGELLKIFAARPAKILIPEGGIPGQVMEFTSEGFIVSTGDPPSGGLLVSRVQPAGRKAMSAVDYLKGYRFQRGDRLGA